METYYEHPKGYRPSKKALQNGIFIADMKMGNRFIASDGHTYEVIRPVVTIRCAGGVAEHDMWARRIGAEDTYLFHCAVGTNPLRYTFNRI